MTKIKTASATQPSRGGRYKNFPGVLTQVFVQVFHREETLFNLLILHDPDLPQKMPRTVEFYR
jgi:hypothetical protein